MERCLSEGLRRRLNVFPFAHSVVGLMTIVKNATNAQKVVNIYVLGAFTLNSFLVQKIGFYAPIVGLHGTNGQEVCSACQEGRYSQSAVDGCLLCPQGRFSDVRGMEECKVCDDKGTFCGEGSEWLGQTFF